MVEFEKLRARLAMLFKTVFCFSTKKQKHLQITQHTQKAPSKKFYQTNPNSIN
jgi:hypothetical protein